MGICIIKMVDYPWIVNSDIIMVNLVPTEKHTFV